jgi:molecular chaperone HscB
MNYFQYFGLEESFSIDQDVLRKQFLNKSRAVHPDLHLDSKALDLDQLAAENNEAYNTLKDELLLIQHVLKINGFDSLYNQKPTAVFLAEMMELNEMIDEAKETEDIHKISHCEQTIQQLETDAAEKWSNIKIQYHSGLAEDEKLPIFKEASQYLMVMKYSNRMKALLKNVKEL